MKKKNLQKKGVLGKFGKQNFLKRNDKVKSKSFELHTLCGVRVMYLCREENGTHHSWPPQNSAHLKSLIDHYREMGSPKDNISNKATKCPPKSKAAGVNTNKLSPHQEATTKSPEPLLPNQEAVDTDLIDIEFANHFWSVDQPPLLSNQEAMGNALIDNEFAWSVDHAVTPPPLSNQEAIENDVIGNEFANHVWSWSSQVAANQIATMPSLPPPVPAPLNQYQEEEEELAVLAPLPQALTRTMPWNHPGNYRWNHQPYNARDYGMCC